MTHDEIISELYGAMQTFRHMGFISDDLYVVFNVIAATGTFAGQKCVAVRLRRRGKEFHFTVAPVKKYEKFAKKWQKFLDDANKGVIADADLKERATGSVCWGMKFQLLMALKEKGIEPPLGMN